MSEPSKRWHRVGQAVVAASLLASLGLTATPTQAAAPVRVVGCSSASLSAELVKAGLNVVAAEPEEADAPDGPDGADGEQPDGAETDDQNHDEQQPRIVGTIPVPAGVGEDDEAALAPLARVDKKGAVATAMTALASPDQRRVKGVELQDEDGYVVWAVEVTYIKGASGPDKNLEVKLDAGSGEVLSVECE